MELHLRNFFDQGYKSNILNTKMNLIKMKNEGVAYFEADIASLSQESEFEIYFHMHPGERKRWNSFPVPKEVYTSMKNKSEKVKSYVWSKYYKRYYNVDEMSFSFFSKFDERPFVAKRFVWFRAKK